MLQRSVNVLLKDIHYSLVIRIQTSSQAYILFARFPIGHRFGMVDKKYNH